MEGTVKWYNRKKGFGFISGEDGQDYFVHFSAIPEGTFLRDNDKVSFDAVDTEKGKQAQNIVLLEKGSEREDVEAPAEEAPAEEAPAEEAPAEEPAEEPAAEEEAPAEEPAEEEAPEEPKEE